MVKHSVGVLRHILHTRKGCLVQRHCSRQVSQGLSAGFSCGAQPLENTDTEKAPLQVRPPDLKKSLTLKEVAGPQPASLKRGSLEASALLLCMRYTAPFHTTTFLKIQSLAESSAASRHCEPPWRAQSLLTSEQAKKGSEGASRLHLRGNGLAADNRVAQEVQHSARAASPQQGCHA